MDIEGQIPPTLPFQREEFPLFGKEGPAGRQGEIFRIISLFNYGLSVSRVCPALVPEGERMNGEISLRAGERDSENGCGGESSHHDGEHVHG